MYLSLSACAKCVFITTNSRPYNYYYVADLLLVDPLTSIAFLGFSQRLFRFWSSFLRGWWLFLLKSLVNFFWCSFFLSNFKGFLKLYLLIQIGMIEGQVAILILLTFNDSLFRLLRLLILRESFSIELRFYQFPFYFLPLLFANNFRFIFFFSLFIITYKFYASSFSFSSLICLNCLPFSSLFYLTTFSSPSNSSTTPSLVLIGEAIISLCQVDFAVLLVLFPLFYCQSINLTDFVDLITLLSLCSAFRWFIGLEWGEVLEMMYLCD